MAKQGRPAGVAGKENSVPASGAGGADYTAAAGGAHAGSAAHAQNHHSSIGDAPVPATGRRFAVPAAGDSAGVAAGEGQVKRSNSVLSRWPPAASGNA